ncbi:MAG: amidohydrolase, partial [Pedobacter sp.]
MKTSLFLALLACPLITLAQNNPQKAEVSKRAEALTEKVINWRRDFHEHPELG